MTPCKPMPLNCWSQQHHLHGSKLLANRHPAKIKKRTMRFQPRFSVEMLLFPEKSRWSGWRSVRAIKMRRWWWWCLGFVGQRGRCRGASVSVCEMGAQPKGVMFERCSSLHCSNLLEVCYVTKHILTHRDTHTNANLTHIYPLSEKKISTQFMPRAFGEELREEGNLPVRLGRGKKTGKTAREKPTGGENRHEGSVIVGLWPLIADQITLSVMLK